MEKPNANQTNPHDVLPLLKSNLSIPEIAERLDISVEAACALVVASLRGSRALAPTSSEGEAAAASPPKETENSILLSARFEPAEGNDLWRRDGTLHSRGAALQIASRGLVVLHTYPRLETGHCNNRK